MGLCSHNSHIKMINNTGASVLKSKQIMATVFVQWIILYCHYCQKKEKKLAVQDILSSLLEVVNTEVLSVLGTRPFLFLMVNYPLETDVITSLYTEET